MHTVEIHKVTEVVPGGVVLNEDKDPKSLSIMSEVKPIFEDIKATFVNPNSQDITARTVERLDAMTSAKSTKISEETHPVLFRERNDTSTDASIHPIQSVQDHRKYAKSIDWEQERCIAIGKLMDRDKSIGASDISYLMKEYAIDSSTDEGQKILREFAKVYARRHINWMPKIIHLFCIDITSKEGQKVLFEIALRAASESFSDLSENILNFGIDSSTLEGQRKLIRLAKMAIQKEYCLAKYIHNYQIDASYPEGKMALVNIAKIIANKDHGYISQYIQNFGLDPNNPMDQKNLIEIAKLASSSDSNISQFIQSYGIRIVLTGAKGDD